MRFKESREVGSRLSLKMDCVRQVAGFDALQYLVLYCQFAT